MEEEEEITSYGEIKKVSRNGAWFGRTEIMCACRGEGRKTVSAKA